MSSVGLTGKRSHDRRGSLPVRFTHPAAARATLRARSMTAAVLIGPRAGGQRQA